MPFDPRDRDMARDRGQVLFRYRPNQTFDHVGSYVAQVRQYARDDAYDGPALDNDYLVAEAMRLVRRWRAEGRGAPAATAGSDRAPEFPGDDPLAAAHYEVVIPGKVFCRVWPRVVRCAKYGCGMVWDAPDPRPGVDDWPPRCPRCHNLDGNRQLQFVFAHQCGELQPWRPPRSCGRCHGAEFRLNDRVSRFKDFRWECLNCGTAMEVRAFCPNTAGCTWPQKMMLPLLHTAGSAYAGTGLNLVNVLTEAEARRAGTAGYVVATLARWLGECTLDEAARLFDAADAPVPQEVADAIAVMEEAGLTEQAAALRRRFFPVDVDELAGRVAKVLGYDPLSDDRGRALAAALAGYQRVLGLRDRIDLVRLRALAVSPLRRDLYARYDQVLESAGFRPDEFYLLGDFPVTYLAVGYARGGFGPAEADLVPYRGRASRGSAPTTLLYAHPTVTEALLFPLDLDRVSRWLVANDLATPQRLHDAGGVKRWFAGHLDPAGGQLPTWPTDMQPGDPEWAAHELYGLLHTVAHQLLRALAVDSGYAEQSLSEYMFPHDLAFVLHPNGGSEFSIGALRTVVEQNLDAVVNRALDNDGCLYDPNCLHANRGADHGCLLLPETSCQAWNRHLSRWYLYGSPDGRMTGYWDPAL